MSVAQEAHDEGSADPLPPCRHRACDRPSTTVTVLVRGFRRWELRYCDEHRGDGVEIGAQLGLFVVPPVSNPERDRSHLSVVPRDLSR